MKQTKEKGITLVALVITIIVLIILAGISIHLLLGENGLLSRAKNASKGYEEKQAKEKLEMVLLDLQAEKFTNPNYTEEYIDKKIQENQMVVNGDIVFVDGYQFQINRSVPKIAASLGKGALEEQIQISITSEISGDYTKATITAQISYEQELTEILLNEERIEIPEKQEGKYNITKEIDANGIYNLVAKDREGKFNIASVTITDITEDMIIKSIEDFVAFRNKVNKGATFEGKTVQLMNDLNLQDICSIEKGSWEPIGTEKNPFKGTFHGNTHTIEYLYIDNTENYQGLFGYVQNGTITGIIIGQHSNIVGNQNVGGIVGQIDYSTIMNCGNHANIEGNVHVGGIAGGSLQSEIIGTYNKADIIANNNLVGGIVGQLKNSTNNNTIKYSYNTGNITGGYYVGGIAGTGDDYAKIYYCYNKGVIKSISSSADNCFCGGIIGRLRAYGITNYCYNLGEVNNTNIGSCVGGITGLISAYDGANQIQERASTVSYCYNSCNVTSKGTCVGGIVGKNEQYCSILNCYLLNTVSVKYNSTSASANVGSSSNYLGKILGRAYSNTSTYVNNNNVSSSMPTVYNVVNGLSDVESTYWSKSNLNEPMLLWEE